MDFNASVGSLIEKALAALPAVPGAPVVCWQMQPFAGPPPATGTGRPARLAFAFAFWTAVPVPGKGTYWCWSYQALAPAAGQPTQAEVSAMANAAVADLTAQVANWRR